MHYVILILLLCPLLHAQEYLPKITRYTTEDGLSSNEVYAIHKDSRGFVWIGTQYGLNRFDGKEFKVYTQKTLPGLKSNIVDKIMEDEEGNLWLIKTKDRFEADYQSLNISLLNIHTQKLFSFEDYFSEASPFKLANISFIQQLSDQSIFFFDNHSKKIYRYHTKSGFQEFNISVSLDYIGSMLQQQNGNYLIGAISTNDGPSNYSTLKVDKNGQFLAKHADDICWRVKYNQQQYQYKTWAHMNLLAFDHLTPDLKPNQACLGTVRDSIYQTEFNPYQQLFWIKRLGSIDVITPKGKIIYQQKEIKENLGEIPILFDKERTWLSNKNDGLLAIDLQPNHFETLQFFEDPLGNSMRGVMKDDSGTLWFSTIHGMGKMDTAKNITILKKEGNFTRFLKDRKGNIWYGNINFLLRYDVIKKQTTSFPANSRAYQWSIFEAPNGEIWVLSDYTGISALNPETGSFYLKCTFPKSEKVWVIYDFQTCDEQSVWVCTNQGLLLVGLDGQILATYNDQQKGQFYLPTKDVHHLYQEEEGVIYLATGDAGLLHCKFNSGTLTLESFRQFTIEHGLSSNSLHAVYPDDYGYLWISSENGIMQFNRQSHQLTKYFKSSGLLHDEFNRIAHYQAEDGTFYLGGLFGLTAFHPKDFSKIQEKQSPPTLAIADFRQFSSKVGQFVNLTPELLKDNTIILQPGDRFFHLNLALLDYENNDNSIYSYRIKGLYGWQNTRDKELNVSGLPFGHHVLEIKAQNGNRQTAANKVKIDIHVLRPFYLQWWFALISLIVGASLISLLVYWRFQQYSLQQQTTQLSHLDKMKSKFFANVSHELRTPLTLIQLPLRQLLSSLRNYSYDKIEEELQVVENSSKDLSRLVNEILDLTKLEAGKLQPQYKASYLSPFLGRIITAFEAGASAKEIHFDFVSFIPEKLLANIDENKLEMVINNLLSNALKFTARKGEIKISADVLDSGLLLVKIKDTGLGIHPEDLPHIFDRYFQSGKADRQMAGGSGIGLAVCKELTELMGGKIEATSELEKGSIFSISLPVEILQEEKYLTDSLPSQVDPLKASSSLTPSSPKSILSKQPTTILLVEDNDRLRHYLYEMLAVKHQVLLSSNGCEALNLLESLKDKNQLPHLILSDAMMPEMDGFTLLEKLKSNKDYCFIPFILLTARADMQDKIQALSIGVDDYITKPFVVEELLLRINNLLVNVKKRKITLASSSTSVKKDRGETIYQPSPSDLQWLKQLEAIVNKELSNSRFALNDLAKELNLSQRQMARKIKQISGLTTNLYLREIKLNKARQLLETGNYHTLTEIIQQIGFENTTHFANLFEKRFGKRPHEYLKGVNPS